MVKTALLVVAYQGYQPTEYGNTRAELETAGIKVVVASNKMGTAQAMGKAGSLENEGVRIDVTLDAVKPEEYDGVFLIGGSGALEFLDNGVVHGIMQKVAKAGKPFGAICISPRIVAHAGLLGGKKATCWDGDGRVDAIFKEHKAVRVHDSVVVDGMLITADGPQAATSFGKAIVAALK